MGGAIAVPMSDEQYHEMMDVAESIVDKEIHEKCLLGSGALVIWNGNYRPSPSSHLPLLLPLLSITSQG